MQNEFFEWDDAKADLNLRKHSVSFEEACTVLFDDFSIAEEDDRENYGEQRMLSLGMSCYGRLLVVVWTQRNGKVRLISALKADRQQRKYYEQQKRH